MGLEGAERPAKMQWQVACAVSVEGEKWHWLSGFPCLLACLAPNLCSHIQNVTFENNRVDCTSLASLASVPYLTSFLAFPCWGCKTHPIMTGKIMCFNYCFTTYLTSFKVKQEITINKNPQITADYEQPRLFCWDSLRKWMNPANPRLFTVAITWPMITGWLLATRDPSNHFTRRWRSAVGVFSDPGMLHSYSFDPRWSNHEAGVASVVVPTSSETTQDDHYTPEN